MLPLAVCLVLAACPALAFAQGSQAALEGVVVDRSGRAVPGATADVRDADTNQHRTTTTDDRGTFQFVALTPGNYDLRVERSGFTPHVHEGLILAIGATVKLTITLTPATISATVTVTAQPPALDASRTSVATVIDPERIEELPVRSRNYLDFVLLAPAVAPSQPAGRSAAPSVLPDSGFSFAGLRPRSNMLTIDGLDNNDEYSGASRTELSLEIIREFQVVSNGWSAENGGAAGGAINVVTKSGANVLHGDAFLFGQSGRLNAQPAFEDTLGMKPSLTRYRAGLAMGGPVVKDRTFYYAAGEYESTVGQSASDIGSHTLSAVNAMLATGALPNLATRQLTVGLFPTTLEETEFSTRVTHQLSERQSLAARFAATDTRESADAFNAGGLSDVSARGSSGTRDLAFMSTWDATIGQRGINEARGQIATRRVELHTGDTQGPSVLIPGVVEFGRPYAGNDLHDQRYLELGDTARWTAGRHVLSAGGEVTHIRLTGSSTDGLGGMYVFSSLDAFLAKTPSSFRQVFGNPAISFSATRSGAFLQDRWTPRAPLTVDVGVRFDSESLSSSLGIANHLTSPRVGLAWTPGPGWVIRGGAGVFADRLILAAFERSLLVNGVQGFEQVVDGAAAASVLAATQGGSLTSALPNVAPSIYTVRPGAWNSASHQVSAGVERGITSDLTVSANYLFVQGRNLPRTVNVNVPPPGTATTTNTARPNPAYTDIFELQPTASSTYHGVTMAVNRRLANEVAWAASYTWSHTTDTASDFEEQPQNPYALGDELGASRYDQRHRLVASALFDLPIGDEEDRKPGDTPGVWVRVFSQIEVAPILRAGSGSPLNPVTGGDEAQTHSVDLSARPPGVARNSLRLPGTATLDLRVLKAITVKPHGKLDLVFEVFNVFNRVNVTELNTVYGGGLTPLATFGRPIGAGAPRHLQFSIDFEF